MSDTIVRKIVRSFLTDAKGWWDDSADTPHFPNGSKVTVTGMHLGTKDVTSIVMTIVSHKPRKESGVDSGAAILHFDRWTAKGRDGKNYLIVMPTEADIRDSKLWEPHPPPVGPFMLYFTDPFTVKMMDDAEVSLAVTEARGWWDEDSRDDQHIKLKIGDLVRVSGLDVATQEKFSLDIVIVEKSQDYVWRGKDPLSRRRYQYEIEEIDPTEEFPDKYSLSFFDTTYELIETCNVDIVLIDRLSEAKGWWDESQDFPVGSRVTVSCTLNKYQMSASFNLTIRSYFPPKSPACFENFETWQAEDDIGIQYELVKPSDRDLRNIDLWEPEPPPVGPYIIRKLGRGDIWRIISDEADEPILITLSEARGWWSESDDEFSSEIQVGSTIMVSGFCEPTGDRQVMTLTVTHQSIADDVETINARTVHKVNYELHRRANSSDDFIVGRRWSDGTVSLYMGAAEVETLTEAKGWWDEKEEVLPSLVLRRGIIVRVMGERSLTGTQLSIAVRINNDISNYSCKRFEVSGIFDNKQYILSQETDSDDQYTLLCSPSCCSSSNHIVNATVSDSTVTEARGWWDETCDEPEFIPPFKVGDKIYVEGRIVNTGERTSHYLTVKKKLSTAGEAWTHAWQVETTMSYVNYLLVYADESQITDECPGPYFLFTSIVMHPIFYDATVEVET